MNDILTENDLLDRLRVKYGEDSGNGPAWAFVPKVRSGAGFDARRTVDAYAMNLWPSRGLTLHAFEIKSSRSDWQRELKNPAKAEEFCALADYFYLVVGDKKIVQSGELPETWGLIVPHGKGLKVAIEAPRLHAVDWIVRDSIMPPSFGRSFLAALLRSATAVGNVTPQDISDAEQRGRDEQAAMDKRNREDYQARFNSLQARVREFEQASGIRLNTSEFSSYGASPDEFGAAVKMVLSGNGEVELLSKRLVQLRDNALSIAKHADGMLSSDAAR